MASKLNLGIKEVFEQAKKASVGVEEAASSLKDEVETKVVSIQKSKMPFFSKFRIKSSEFIKNHKADIKYLLLIIPIIATLLLVKAVQYRQGLNSRAGLHQASIAFQLQNWNLPPENPFEVWVNSDSPVSFVNINISFDPKLIKLTHEITTTGSLTRIIKVTSMADANTTGAVSIVLGLDPSMSTSSPSGAFQVASLIFDANTSNPDVATTVSFNTSQMQLVASDQSAFQLTATGLNLILNPIATPTPSVTPTPGPTLTPTPGSTQTPAPTKAPRPTQKPNPGKGNK